MKSEQFSHYQEHLVKLRGDLLAKIEQQRGDIVSRAEVTADHFSHTEDSQA